MSVNDKDNTDRLNFLGKTLVDYDIDIESEDNGIVIKKKLAKLMGQSEKKIKLTHNGVPLDDNKFLIGADSNEIGIELVTDEEASSSVVFEVVSLDKEIPKYIQMKKTDKFSDIMRVLKLEQGSPSCNLRNDNGTEILRNETIEESGLEDNAKIYVDYGEVNVAVTNPTGEMASSYIKITAHMTGLDLKEKLFSDGIIPAGDIILLIMNKVGIKFEMIEDSQELYKYSIPEESIIKWVPVKRFDNIDMKRTPLNKPGSPIKVFEAKDKSTGIRMAMKEYFIGQNIEIYKKSKALGNELINCWKLKGCGENQRIIKMLGIYSDGPKIYFAMELMKESLRDVVDRAVYLSDKEVKHFTRQIIEGLQFLHKNKIIHANLNCSSVLLDDKGDVKLSSFGLSKYMIESNNDVLINGLKGTGVGEEYFYWAAPEAISESKCSVYTDVWSLGATAVEMRTGKKPWHQKTATDASRWIQRDKRLEYAQPEYINKKAFKTFKDFIACCTHAEPKKRSTLSELFRHAYLK